MEKESIVTLLKNVKQGRISIEDAILSLKKLPFEDVDCAKIDNHRCLRTGVPEVIYCEGKSVSQIRDIMKVLIKGHFNILATRASRDVFLEIKKAIKKCEYHEQARIIVANPRSVEQVGEIAVICAGTSDIPVAEEASVTAEVLGNKVTRIYDVGVAGIHRLLSTIDYLHRAHVAIVVAGMEGALASVVTGMVSYPVIGVPSSIGYGTSFGGVTALLSMLNSCASGLSVVNIDNGFGAGYQASLINKLSVGKN